MERVECLVNWLETQYPSPAFPSRRTDTGPGRERPHYYAAYAILKGRFPVTKDVQHGFGEPDPEGLQDLMARVTVTPAHGQPLFAPRVTMTSRATVFRTRCRGPGAQFLSPSMSLRESSHGFIGGESFRSVSRVMQDLVDECARVDAAASLSALFDSLQ